MGNKSLVILIDTGSTHSFIDFQVAKELKANISAAPPLIVTVANGHKVLSKLKCSNFKWMMHGELYQADLRVIRLDGSSIILGIDWLQKCGKFTFDYMNHSVTFNKGGKLITVKGITGNAQLRAIGARQWYKAGVHGNCCAIAHLRSSECKQEEHIPHKIQEILEQYASVFQEPKTLPPKRSHDHRIPLYPSATPVNIRPYKHSHE